MKDEDTLSDADKEVIVKLYKMALEDAFDKLYEDMKYGTVIPEAVYKALI